MQIDLLTKNCGQLFHVPRKTNNFVRSKKQCCGVDHDFGKVAHRFVYNVLCYNLDIKTKKYVSLSPKLTYLKILIYCIIFNIPFTGDG